MKVRSLAFALALGSSSLLAFALNACSSSTDDVASGTDAAVDHTTQQAEVEDTNLIPCDARLVLQTVCQQCHARPEKNGAPFPLQRLSDVMAQYQDQVVRDDMIGQLESGRMPLAPVKISATDKATLLAWLKSGAPAVPATTCTDTDAGDDAASDTGAGEREAGFDAGDAAADADAM